uniref:Chromosome 2 open reading frame 69 n=1 Tax=Fundulus heteroclitus TaxID=8078 RepID=A0A3Q2P935_FUNHE
MLASRAAGCSIITAAEHMSSEAGSTQCELPDSPHGRRLQRLLGVSGCRPNRVNDLLLLRPESDGESCSGTRERSNNRHVVFFHGDIQNFKEQMVLQPEAAPWLSWSLEQVALILGQRFPSRNIWVVKASRMYLHKFSCYQNFVDSNMFGAPEHAPYAAGQGAFAQLRTLLSNAMERAKLQDRLPPAGGAPAGFSLTLVGFSKGCVVLNQLVYELRGARADPRMAAFVERISDMFWLDGGHPGGGETWVTDKEALRELAASGVSVHAHVTPYEVRDPARAWVGREYGVFTRTLEELGACPSKKLHFQEEPPCILNHFRVILEF